MKNIKIKKLKDKIKGIKLTLFIIVLLVFLYRILITYIGMNLNDIFIMSNNSFLFIFLFGPIIIPVVVGLLFFYFINRKIIINFIKKGFNQIDLKVILFGYLFLLGFSFFYSYLINFFGYNIDNSFFSPLTSYPDMKLNLLVLFFVGFAAFYEEVVFRGLIFNVLTKWFAFLKSKSVIGFLVILITSVLFGIIHTQYSNTLIINVIFLGIILGIIRYKYGIINSIFVHVINNVLIVFISGTIPLLLLLLNNNGNKKEINNLIISLKKEVNIPTTYMIKLQKKHSNYNKNSELLNPYIYSYYYILNYRNNSCYKKIYIDKSISKKEVNKCIIKIKKDIEKFKKYKKLYDKQILKGEEDIKNIEGFIKFSSNILKYTYFSYIN